MKELSLNQGVSFSSETNNTSFLNVLEKLNSTIATTTTETTTLKKKKSNDPRDIRLAAVSSALIETILDRRRSSDSSNKSVDYKDIIPFEIFGCTLTALEGTITAITQEEESNSNMLLEQQLPLLQILQLVLPYCYIDNNQITMFLSQYKLLSRVLRSLKNYYSSNNTITMSSTMETMDELGGYNAMLRHIITTSREAIIAYNHCINNSNDKNNLLETAKKLYEHCILSLLEDKRPKVRRTAQSSIMEFISTTTSESNWMEHHFLSYSMKYIKQHSSNFNKSKKKKEEDEMIKLTHLFNFLQSIITTIIENNDSNNAVPNTVIEISNEIMKLSMTILSSYDVNNEEYKIIFINASWHVILSLLDTISSNTLDDSISDDNDTILDFSSKVLATLLQVPNGKPFNNAKDTSSVIKDHCHVVYSKLIVSSYNILLSSSDNKYQLIVKQLLPPTFSILINSCEYIHYNKDINGDNDDEEDGEGNTNNNKIILQSCISECQRFLSSISSSSSNNHTTNLISLDDESLIEKYIHSLSIFLQIRYRTYYDVVLPCFATGLATILSSSASTSTSTSLSKSIQNILKELVDMYSMVYDKNTKLSIENSIGLIIQRIGIESFLNYMPLSTNDNDIICIPSKKRAWLLPVLKTFGGYCSSVTSTSTQPNLSFFQNNILPLARKCDAASYNKQLTPLEVSIEKTKCIGLWSLFSTCFCKVYPSDVSIAFPKLLNTILKAMQDTDRYPSLINIICSGITSLANGASKANNEEDIKCISASATKLLPTLFKLVDTLSGATTTTISKQGNDDTTMEIVDENKQKEENIERHQYQLQYITRAISELAKISPKKFLQNLFQKLLQRLVISTTSLANNNTDDDSAYYKLSSLLYLAQGLVSSKSLNNDCILLLYKSIKPCIIYDNKNNSNMNTQILIKIQKKAYKVMADICQYYTSFLILDDVNRRNDVMELLIGSIVTCHVSARYWRLKCLYCLMEGGYNNQDGDNDGDDNPMDIIPQIMGEVILCLKDRNTKTRELAYQLILSMYYSIENVTTSTAMDDDDDTSNNNNTNIKYQFFQVVTAGLAGQTPAMRSASVMALSRLIFEVARSDDTIHALLPDLLSTVLLLLHKGSTSTNSSNNNIKREEIKSCVSFIRVTIAAMSTQQLEPLLSDIISTLFQQQKKMKRFRSKIKIILQKLVKIYGYEKVTPLMPEEDKKLLEYLKKTQEKEHKKKMMRMAANDNATTRTNADFNQMMDSEEERDDSDDDDSDSDDDDSITRVSRSTKYTTKSGKTSKKGDKTISPWMAEQIEKDNQSFGTTMAKTKATTKSTKSNKKTLLLRNEINNDVHDFLHSNMYNNLQMLDENDEFNDDSDFDFSDDDDDGNNVLEFDDDGKMIIPDDNKKDNEEDDNDSDSASEKDVQMKSNKERRISKHQTVKDAKQNKNKKGGKNNNVKELGAAYKSKKAKGDVKLQHQAYEPYAFVPLDSRNYSKKKRGMTVKQMGSVVSNNKRKRG